MTAFRKSTLRELEKVGAVAARVKNECGLTGPAFTPEPSLPGSPVPNKSQTEIAETYGPDWWRSDATGFYE